MSKLVHIKIDAIEKNGKPKVYVDFSNPLSNDLQLFMIGAVSLHVSSKAAAGQKVFGHNVFLSTCLTRKLRQR